MQKIWGRRRRAFLPAIVGFAFAFLLASSAGADIVPAELYISVDGQNVFAGSPDGTVSGDLFSADGSANGAGYDIDWNLAGDIDPVAHLAVAVTNNTGAAQDFVVTIVVPVIPIGPTSVTGGSVSGSITDNNGDGAVLTGIGGLSLYTSFIDGSPYQTLIDQPFSFVEATPYGSGLVSSASFGNPIPSLPGPAVTNSIAVQLAFNLSAGDTATLNGVFVVEPAVVPEPASVALLGFGLAGMAAVRMRRKGSAKA
ncbi:MAG: PEP-CTERM sorting domain-containing protein [bacterium]|nr:PEP-CTERM sorting domain-containing protein [bacterium]